MPLLDAVITLILILALIGLLLYLINRFVPMESGIREFMNVAVKVVLVIALILWVLGLIGYGPVTGVRILR